MPGFDIGDDEHVDRLMESVLCRSVRPAAVAAIYLATLPALGAPWWKAAVTAAVAFLLVMLPLGARILQGIAVVLLIGTLGIWSEILPRGQIVDLMHALVHR